MKTSLRERFQWRQAFCVLVLLLAMNTSVTSDPTETDIFTSGGG